MARLQRRDVEALTTVAGFGALTLWLASRGRPVAAAAADALTLMAAALIPLYVLASILNRPGKDRSEGAARGADGAGHDGEAGEGGEWNPERTFERARAAVEVGDVWRAKEILQGTLASQPYHPVLYEWYGRVLLEMRDLMNAGKYLFLSGRRDPAYEEPIAIFLNRFRDKRAGELVRVLPSRARDPSRLPPIVVDELRAMGWKPREAHEPRLRPPTSPRWRWVHQAALTVAALMFILVLILGFGAFLDLVRR